ncbi:MAG: hypothetical protein ACXVZV_13985 [Terriglobales bacterium]
MPKKTRIAGILCGLLVAGMPALAGAHRNAGPKVPVKPAAQQPADAAAPPQLPPTPEEMPATPPQVTMHDGKLSIFAENSTLGDVLSAVRKLTGAGIEVPNGANSERIAVHLGPGNPQDVLQQLFAGSKFNYVILGSPDNSAAVQRIILTSRTAGGAGPSAPANNYPEVTNRLHSSPPPPDYQADSGVDDEIVQPEQQSQQQEEVTPPPENQDQQAEQQYSGPGGQAQQQGPKTPEQLLQELQRLQQQQQQNDQSRPPRSTVQPE